MTRLNIHLQALHSLGSNYIMMLIYLLEVIHNSSFVHQPQGRTAEWLKTNKQAECEFSTEKVSQG